MKKIIVSLLICSGLFANAQVKKTPPAKTPAKPISILKNLNDSASYAIGVSVANFYKSQGVKKLNVALITKAINDVYASKKVALDDAQASNIIMDYLNKLEMAKSQPTITAGEVFLKENKKRSGVKVTSSGLQYEIITPGTGPLPKLEDKIIAHYAGTLLNGTEVDNSYKRGQPLTIGVSEVIKGWTEALLMMPVGSKWKLYIPYYLGYGPAAHGEIPGGSTLVFEIELIGIAGK